MENQQQTAYHLVIIGANCGIGRQCVLQALHSGHHVTAILRTPSKLTLLHPHLKIVQADVTKDRELAAHFTGKDAIISAIGVGKSLFDDKPTTVYSDGAANILQAMDKAGVRRALFISAAGIEVSSLQNAFVRFFTRYVL